MIKISENLAVLIWDHLNETALNVKNSAFRRALLSSRKRLENAMKKSGCGIPKSDHGRAK